MIPTVRMQDVSQLPYVEIIPSFEDLEGSGPVFATPSLILNCQRKAKLVRCEWDLISQETDEVVGTLEGNDVVINEEFLNKRFLDRRKVSSVQIRLVTEANVWVESGNKQEQLNDFLKGKSAGVSDGQETSNADH